MTDAPLPAVRLAPELDRYARLGRWLAAAESGSAAVEAVEMAAALRLAFADMLGLPIYAASEVTLIRGQVGLTAKLLRGLAAQKGYTVTQEHLDEESCTAAVWFKGEELGRYTFSMEDAHRAGLVKDGGAWTAHPKRMLWARASKFAIDDFAPDVSVGLVTVEEGEEVAAADGSRPAIGAQAAATGGDPSPGAGADTAAPGEAAPEPPELREGVSPEEIAAAKAHFDEARAAHGLTESSGPEDAWQAVDPEGLVSGPLEAARSRHFAEVARLDADPSAVPPGQDDTWNDTSKRLALELYDADSRSDLLNPAQWQRLTGRMIELADHDLLF